MNLKNSRWTMVMVGVIALLMVGTMVWASPPAGAPSAPLQAYDANNADKVDGLHASKRPKANTLLALDKNKKFPNGVIPGAIARDGEVMRIVKKNDGPDSGLDADLLDGQHASELLPSGVIVMWSGAIEDIPEGWALCDGTNGSPDLRDRFVYGVSEGETPGATGGIATHSHFYNDVPEHKHTASSSTAGEHNHRSMMLDETRGVYAARGFPPSQPSWYVYTEYAFRDSSTNLAGGHDQIIDIEFEGVNGPETVEASSLPPFYKLAFIIKL